MTTVCDVPVAARIVVGVLVWAGSTLLRHAGAEFEGDGRRKRQGSRDEDDIINELEAEQDQDAKLAGRLREDLSKVTRVPLQSGGAGPSPQPGPEPSGDPPAEPERSDKNDR
jgi:hypothetical protein